MRTHDKMLFLGNGDHSAAQELRLLERLWGAFNTLGGLQQGVPATDPAWAEAHREHEDLVKDIAMALTGRGVRFVERG